MARPRKRSRARGANTPVRVVAYTRVSTREQERSGVSLEAQRDAIAAEASHRGWTVTAVLTDVASGRSTVGRSGLDQAIKLLEGGEADALVATKLDRVSRSVVDFGALVERSREHG